ncbi:hypothetical protein [Flavobacterium filum]|uniref:hypothetical protein n=1 Tax=Flavobacterium filum TaxID=370974 RepID=UPI0023F54B1B|nr:hypothetical protein [Flavobacterium filum]
MKNTLVLIIIIISLGFSINWMIKTNYENEPVIATLGLIIILIGYISYQKKSNKSSIKGNYNTVDQSIQKSGKADTNKENELKIEGDRNEINQKN